MTYHSDYLWEVVAGSFGNKRCPPLFADNLTLLEHNKKYGKVEQV